MIEMAVGYEYVADPLMRPAGGQNCLKVRRVEWPRVDHCQIALAKQIRIGATKGHRGRIGRKDAAQIGGKRPCYTEGRIKTIWWLHLSLAPFGL